MSTRTSSYDVAIVGAGAAGLAAAAELARRDCSVCVLEARDRVGGRILTRREPGLPAPLELGAEFVHGRSAATMRWLAAGNTALIDAAETRWILGTRKPRGARGLQPAEDLFGALRRGLGRVPRPRHDLPLREFLEGPVGRKLGKQVRDFAVMLVEGFDAADSTRVSTLGTIEEWCGEGAADAPTFRPQGGYASLLDTLASALDPDRVSLRLGTTVHEVRWKRGGVEIDATRNGRSVTVRAERAIVTLPLGILQLPTQAPNAVRFVPALAAKQKALTGLATGAVVKVLLRFHTPFWEQIADGRYADAAFFHKARSAFPTFWTPLPLRAPLIAAWSAGPAAQRLAGLAESEIVHEALECFGALFGRADPAAELHSAYLHDWQADPFACGAYSYVVAGGGDARAELARPLRGTLFFAGEAADTSGESGTVGGALASARRVVAQLLDA